MSTKTMDSILSGLMTRYESRVPQVHQIINAMKQASLILDRNDIINDHIAFRTMGVPNLGIQSLEKVFLAHGYQRRDAYRFDAKKLNAFWYSPPSPNLNWPRIFISELCVNELSKSAQSIIKSYTSSITTDPVDTLDLHHAPHVDQFLHSPLWRTPTWTDYATLLEESEYAAWVIYNRYYLNHFTISIHHLPPGYNTIPTFNQFIEQQGIRLNRSGGKMKVSLDGKLRQSATVADMVNASFSDGNQGYITQLISGSYVEFAERLDGRDGFDSQNADKIFESTYRSETDAS